MKQEPLFDRVLIAVVSTLTPRPSRRYVLNDIDDGFNTLAESDIHQATTWRRTQLLRALLPALRMRLTDRESWTARLGEPLGNMMNMNGLVQDLKFAGRGFKRSPGFFGIAVTVLTIGITANTAIFAVAKALFLDPLPYQEAGQLVKLMEWNGRQNRPTTISPANYLDLKSRNRSLTDITVFNLTFPTMTGAGDPVRLTGSRVSWNFFDVLGVLPLLGAAFAPQHGSPGNENVVVLSHGLWTSRFGGDESVIGSTVAVNNSPYEVIGVMPDTFVHPEPVQSGETTIWLVQSDLETELDRGQRYLHGIARLKPDATLEDAQLDLTNLSAALALEYPASNNQYSAILTPLRDDILGENSTPLTILAAASIALLLIVTTNLSGLLLTRSQGRTREFAVRSALGAGTARIRRLVVVEALSVAAISVIASLIILGLSANWFDQYQATQLKSPFSIGLDLATIGFLFAVAFVAAVSFGSAPAFLATRSQLSASLRSGTGGAGRTRRAHWLGSGLVVAEVALASMLLFGAMLLSRSFQALYNTPVGFVAENMVTFELSVRRETDELKRSAYAAIKRELKAVPGVSAIDMVSDLHFTRMNSSHDVYPEGQDIAPEDVTSSEFHTTGSSDYFAASGIELIRGRLFDSVDEGSRGQISVINRSMALRHWSATDVIGKRYKTSADGEDITIIGVVEDVLDDGYRQPAGDRAYYPYWNSPRITMTMVLKSSLPLARIIEPVKQAVWRVDPNLPLAKFATMSSVIDESVARERLARQFVTLFSVTGTFLAMLGLYGITAYVVGQRTREYGIRSALGATSSTILRGVIGSSLSLGLAGIALGLVLSITMGRMLSGFIFGVSPSDPTSLLAVPIVLGLTSIFAGLIPAIRASQIDPVISLKAD